MARPSRGAEVDYVEEGRRLLQAVHLGDVNAPLRYSPCDPLWRHPGTGAILYVGNAAVASNRESLKRLNITRIVNCQDSDGRNYFEDDAELRYLRFLIGRWREVRAVRDGGDGTWRFWEPYFAFLLDSLNSGENVLVHCLAGAHRAGTAGVASLMLLQGWGPEQATAAAKRLRPAIDPIGGFPELLKLLEHARNGRQDALPLPGLEDPEAAVDNGSRSATAARVEALGGGAERAADAVGTVSRPSASRRSGAPEPSAPLRVSGRPEDRQPAGLPSGARH
mmetsp:Transcript_13159/g.21450  ORF Transcript_13159/g.21450 Transcript_13159/m.21450 type:complete len:279 (-) Transcript_13159:64-900(-)